MWARHKQIINQIRSFTIIINDQLFVKSNDSVRKGSLVLRTYSIEQTSNLLSFLMLIELMKDSFIKIFLFPMLLERHFSHTLTRNLFNNRLLLFVFKTACFSSTFFILTIFIFTSKFLELPSYCPITYGFLSPCFSRIFKSH